MNEKFGLYPQYLGHKPGFLGRSQNHLRLLNIQRSDPINCRRQFKSSEYS